MNQNEDDSNENTIVTLDGPDGWMLRQRSIKATVSPYPLINRMVAVVQKYNALGLAAIQIGSPIRVIVVRQQADAIPAALVNPRITWRSKATNKGIEGCLSLPGLQVEIERNDEIMLSYLGGKRRVSGVLARVIQHEVDHLNGILLIDYLSKQNKV